MALSCQGWLTLPPAQRAGSVFHRFHFFTVLPNTFSFAAGLFPVNGKFEGVKHPHKFQGHLGAKLPLVGSLWLYWRADPLEIQGGLKPSGPQRGISIENLIISIL